MIHTAWNPMPRNGAGGTSTARRSDTVIARNARGPIRLVVPAHPGRCQMVPVVQPAVSCVPVRTWRPWRGLFSLWAFILTVGLIGITLGNRQHLARVAAGDLIPQHGMVQKDCAACHTAFSSSAVTWMRALWHGPDPDGRGRQMSATNDTVHVPAPAPGDGRRSRGDEKDRFA